MNTDAMSAGKASDGELVLRSVAGSSEAFGQIVTRYQSLICALTYSGTGSLTGSQDLSQETFIIAWKRLPELREPGNLSAWLCGIARNLCHRLRRTQIREPVHGAEQLDAEHETAAIGLHPGDQAISADEEAIMWRSLERIPETYREPLVLYYREHQSVECMALVLELSEEVIRQRLSRGRKLLQKEVAAFVEGALRRSAPGPDFAGSVLAALPVSAVGVATGVGTAKSGSLLSLVAAPVLGLLASASGSIAIVRDSTTPDERRSKIRLIGSMWIAGGCLWLGEYLFRLMGNRGVGGRVFVEAQVAWHLLWAMVVTPLIIVYVRRHIAISPELAFTWSYQSGAGRRATAFVSACAMTFGALAWLFYLGWEARDYLTAGVTGAVGAAITIWLFTCFYWPTAIAGMHVSWQRLAWVPTLLIAGTILLMLNWRLDLWIAIVRNTDLAEAHRILPMWIIHLSTMLLIAWIAAVVSATRPKVTSPQSPQ
jgi:RNA polymerase sigma factor (sigma-70 family)